MINWLSHLGLAQLRIAVQYIADARTHSHIKYIKYTHILVFISEVQ